MKTETTDPTLKKRKPTPQPHHLSHDERFWRLYLAAFQGLHTQFEQHLSDASAFHSGGKAEIDRSRQLAIRAWNSACFACEMFEDKEIDEFNSTVKVGRTEKEDK